MTTDDDKNGQTKHDLTQEIVECRRHGYILSGKFLGQGAYAKVYLGHATQETIAHNPRIKNATMDSTSCKVAIKIISSESAPKIYISKFLPREISTMNKCYKHKNVVRLYDMFATIKRVYLIMEYATSGDLLSYINQCCVKNPCNSVSEAVAKIIFRDIVLGLHFIHHKGVAHRDLKCENILLSNGVNVKLTDFGFAVDTETKKDLLKTHCGSYAYAPPEILKQQNYDGKLADLWSLGVILFAMVNGGLPFKESSAKAVLAAMKKPVYFKSHLSADCKSIIRGLLKIKPQRRLSISDILFHPWISSITDSSMIRENEKGTLRSIAITGTGDKNDGKNEHSFPLISRVCEPEKVLNYLQQKMSPCSGLKQEQRYMGFTKPKVAHNNYPKKTCSPKLTSKTMLQGKIISTRNSSWRDNITKQPLKTVKEESGDVKSSNDYKQSNHNEIKVYSNQPVIISENKTKAVEPLKEKIENLPVETKSNTDQTESSLENTKFKKSTSPNVINLKIDRKSAIKCGVFSDIFKHQNLNAFPMNLYSLPYQHDTSHTLTKQQTSPLERRKTADNSPSKSEVQDVKTYTIQQIDMPQSKAVKVEVDNPPKVKPSEPAPKIKAKSVSPAHRQFNPVKTPSKNYKNVFANHISDTTPKPLKYNEEERVCRTAFQSLDTVQYHLTCSHAKRRNAILKSKGFETKKSECSDDQQTSTTNYSNQKTSYPEKIVNPKQTAFHSVSPTGNLKSTVHNNTSYKYNYSPKNLDRAKVQHILNFSVQKQLHNSGLGEGDDNSYTEIVTLAVPQNSKQKFPKNYVHKMRKRSAFKNEVQDKLVLPKCKQAFIPLPSCGIATTWHSSQRGHQKLDTRPQPKIKSSNKQIVLKLKNR